MIASEPIVASDLLAQLPVAAVFVVAGLVKGVVGLGLPTVAMGLLALRMSPAEAAALLIVPSLVTNLWQTRPWRALAAPLRRLASMQAGVCVGTWLGMATLGAPAGAWATTSLGAALVLYAGWALRGARGSVSPEREAWLGPIVGAITGAVTAATGVFVLPAVPYLQALGLRRDALIQAMGISFTVSTLALAVGLYGSRDAAVGELGASAAMLLPAIAGMSLGALLRRRLPAETFRRFFFAGLLLLGVAMVAKGAIGSPA